MMTNVSPPVPIGVSLAEIAEIHSQALEAATNVSLPGFRRELQ